MCCQSWEAYQLNLLQTKCKPAHWHSPPCWDHAWFQRAGTLLGRMSEGDKAAILWKWIVCLLSTGHLPGKTPSWKKSLLGSKTALPSATPQAPWQWRTRGEIMGSCVHTRVRTRGKCHEEFYCFTYWSQKRLFLYVECEKQTLLVHSHTS